FYTVSLSNASDEVVTVRVDTADGTATVADNDYVAVTNRTLTFTPGGPLSQQTAVRINGDTKFETDQTLSLVLSAATNAGGIVGSPATTTILNDDSRPTISINDRSVPETN